MRGVIEMEVKSSIMLDKFSLFEQNIFTDSGSEEYYKTITKKYESLNKIL